MGKRKKQPVTVVQTTIVIDGVTGRLLARGLKLHQRRGHTDKLHRELAGLLPQMTAYSHRFDEDDVTIHVDEAPTAEQLAALADYGTTVDVRTHELIELDPE